MNTFSALPFEITLLFGAFKHKHCNVLMRLLGSGPLQTLCTWYCTIASAEICPGANAKITDPVNPHYWGGGTTTVQYVNSYTGGRSAPKRLIAQAMSELGVAYLSRQQSDHRFIYSSYWALVHERGGEPGTSAGTVATYRLE
jgi:hypothetical protein